MKVVISNVFGSFNRGDALLVEGVVNSINESLGGTYAIAGIAQFPELERTHLPIVRWLEAPTRSRASAVSLRRFVNAYLLVCVLAYLVFPLVGRVFLWAMPKSRREAVLVLSEADLVISCAGGFLLDVNKSIYGNLLQLIIALRGGARVIIAPQTIGPISSLCAKFITKKVLSSVEVVCVREDCSYQFLTEELLLSGDKIIRGKDIAFDQNVACVPEAGRMILGELGVDHRKSIVGCTVVDWPFPDAKDPKEARERYVIEFARLLREIHEAYDCQFVLFNQVASDLSLGKRLAQLCAPWVTVDESDRSTMEMRNMISACDYFIGSRFHSCVFSLLAGIPTISIAYTYKSTGIMRDLDMGDLVFDISTFDACELKELLGDMFDRREYYVERVRRGRSQLEYPDFSEVLRGMLSQS